MMTRKRQRELNAQLAIERRTLLDDIGNLRKQFEREKPAPKKRAVKEKRKLLRHNHRVKPLHMEKILELRHNRKFSYRQISEALTIRPQTIYMALKRYEARGALVDLRATNGRKNPRRKITPEIEAQLLDRRLLQEWSGLNLSQRCFLLERDFGLKIS